MTWNKEKDRTHYSYHNMKTNEYERHPTGPRVIRKCRECSRAMHHDITSTNLPELFEANLCKICYE